MTLYEKEMEAMAVRRQEGIDSMCELIKALTIAGRTADIQLVLENKDERERLLKEFGFNA